MTITEKLFTKLAGTAQHVEDAREAMQEQNQPGASDQIRSDLAETYIKAVVAHRRAVDEAIEKHLPGAF